MPTSSVVAMGSICASVGRGVPNDSEAGGKLQDHYTCAGPAFGEGTFGVVLQMRHKQTGKVYAVKAIDRSMTPEVDIKSEVDLLKKVSSPFTVRLHTTYIDEQFAALVMDAHHGGSMEVGMQRHWTEKGQIPIPVVLRITGRMLKAAHWLHRKNVIHRDLKPDNFLLACKDIDDPACQAILGDFGSARVLKPGQRLAKRLGTRPYMAPELFRGSYGLAVDVWALGVAVYEMVSGAFCKQAMGSTPSRFPDTLTDECISFLRTLLAQNEFQRSTAERALEHAFLSPETTNFLV